VLLICLTSVRLGIAAIASVREWLNRKGLALQGVGYKGELENHATDYSKSFTGFTDFTTDLTDCTKPTDVWKRHMSDHEGLQYTAFPQLGSNVLLTTSHSQETP
jgi:hypothetical protein